MDDLWTDKDKQNAVILKATDMTTSFIENKGNGKFTISAMPLATQMAPVYGMVAKDVDQDGNLDLVIVGNDFGMEPFTGRHDAFMGLYMKGNGKPLSIAKSGLFINGDAKGLATIKWAKGGDILVATQNQDSLKVYRQSANTVKPLKYIKLKADDFYADIIYKNSSKRRVEFYYGSTYLSQSSPNLQLGADAVKITITGYSEKKREITN